MSNSFIWPTDRNLSGSTTPDQSGAGSNGNEEILCIPKRSNISGASPSEFLVSYQVQLLCGVLPFLQLSSRCIILAQVTGFMNDKENVKETIIWPYWQMVYAKYLDLAREI